MGYLFPSHVAKQHISVRPLDFISTMYNSKQNSTNRLMCMYDKRVSNKDRRSVQYRAPRGVFDCKIFSLYVYQERTNEWGRTTLNG